MKKSILFLSALISIFVAGCRYDKEEELYPPNGGVCSTGNVTYSGTIVQIMNANACVSCHSAVSPAGGVVVNTYNGLKTVAQNGRLYGSITHATGYIAMPLGSTKMSECDIAKVKAWIDAGAPNN